MSSILRAKLALPSACAMLALLVLAPSEAQAATPPTISVNYAPHWRQALDLYVPPDAAGPFPVVVYVHGGGWLAGDKDQADRYVDEVLSRGWALASINYRYSFQAHFPAQLHDCKAAIRWLRAHAGEYQLDDERFAIFGESAGGHLASLVATTADDASLEGNVGGNLGHSSDVLAVIHGYGPTDLFQLAAYSVQRGSEITSLIGHDIYDIIEHQNVPGYSQWVNLVNVANPATHASAADPPAALVHGLMDHVVPSEQSELLADALDDAGASATLRLLHGIGHEIPDGELDEVYAFLAQQFFPSSSVIACVGESEGDAFGSALAVIGDVNQDGADDFVAGAPFNDDRGADAGRISVHSGLDGSILRIIRGAEAGDRFGWSLAAAGDVNSDGRPDFVVGSPRSDISGQDSGRVDVFSGGTWKRLRTFDGEHAGDQLGFAVAAADVLGDDAAEILAAAPCASQPHIHCGRVLAWSAADGALLRRFKGTAENDRFGWSIAGAGDTDGDGHDEIVIGAPHSDLGGSQAGAVCVWGHDGTRWMRRFLAHGSTGDQLGFAVAGLGDGDGDGLADIVAGAPGARTDNGVRSGVARVYAPAAGAVLAVLQPLQPQTGERFGSAITGIGDVDGDGLADVAVGAYEHASGGVVCGAVTLHRSTGGLLTTLQGTSAGALHGKALASRYVNGGGAGEFIAGAPGEVWNGAHRGIVYTLTVP